MSRKKAPAGQLTKKVCEFPPDSDSQELRVLVNDPRYVCMECGKSAAKGDNLCRPERMYSSW